MIGIDSRRISISTEINPAAACSSYVFKERINWVKISLNKLISGQRMLCELLVLRSLEMHDSAWIMSKLKLPILKNNKSQRQY